MMTITVTLAVWCVLFPTTVTMVQTNSHLRVDFYDEDCPELMTTMREAMGVVEHNDPVNLPALLRLWSHDAMVTGPDGSVLLSSKKNAVTPAEKAERDAPPNLSLFGFEAVEFLKTAVEEACPGVVSCADILALSAQLAIEMTGGPHYRTHLGRRDSRTSKYTDAVTQLPVETMTMSQLVTSFAAMGLTQHDLGVLSGAHTIGFAHCSAFMYRLYSYNSSRADDPSLDGTLADQLKRVCPRQNVNPTVVQALDITTIDDFDNGFYFNLLLHEGILESDQLLYDHSETKSLVDSFASNKSAFFAEFVQSIIKLGNNRVLTGSQGEIRLVCDRMNPQTHSS